MRISDWSSDVCSSDLPTIAAISGMALGGGMELTLAADFRIAASTASFGQTEINVGLIPGAGGTQRLSRLVELTNAKEMILIGDRIDAHEASRIGLVKTDVALDDLMDEATKQGEEVLRKGGGKEVGF